ncbi:MAG: GntR family transcriptional regulator, partial [Oscillospiraceae bacterium]
MDGKTPKYVNLANWIKEKICADNLRAGDKFYTENELSKMFNVSRQTVRQAISVLEKENVL